MHKNEENRFDVASNPPIVNCQLSIVHSPKGFTLVELLVVIAIIGMLAGLITVAAGGAMRRAREASIRMEIGQIDMAIEQYKNEHGEYPPDMYDDAALVRHVKKRWPRFQFPSSATTVANQALAIRKAVTYVYFNSDRYSNTLLESWGVKDPKSIDYTKTVKIPNNSDGVDVYISNVGCLALWLGGFPNSSGKFSGFDADPSAPFGKIYSSDSATSSSGINDGATSITRGSGDVVKIGTYENKTNFVMEIGKNVIFAMTTKDGTNYAFPCLGQNLHSDFMVPYVYFRAVKGAGPLAYAMETGTSRQYNAKYYSFADMFSGTGWEELGVATVYARPCDPFGSNNLAVLSWHENERFQIIHPGLDGKFNDVGRTRPTDTVTTSGDTFRAEFFRSVDPNVTVNALTGMDYDNISNLSAEPRIDSMAP